MLDPGPARIVLGAPIGPNTNHRSTAFGGSVSTLATLAGWALVHRRLQEHGRAAHVVIQNGAIEYRSPITTDFRATCDTLDQVGWRRLLRGLDRHGRGRVRVSVRIEAEGTAAAHFTGAYVALGS